MTATLLILRPEPGASATATLAGARGFSTIVAPLFHIRPLAWAAPATAGIDAVMLTSANAARNAGPGLAAFRALPLYAVGAATAVAAHAIGFAEVRTGEADAATLLALAEADGRRHILHLAGREHRPLAGEDIAVTRRLVYAADATDTLATAARAALAAGAIALLHSPRAARLFRALAEDASLVVATMKVAAISPAALAAAGDGWRASAAATVPTDDALLDAAARLCDQDAREDG